jgi:ABC-type lipoprotein export system ATPase subunit
MTESRLLIQLTDVAKSYETGDGAPPTKVLEDVDLEIQPGESLAIVGPSGCGKSTLLNIVGTLDRPSAGKVLFENRDLTNYSDNELAAFRSQKIGFVFQSHHLLPQCSVLENVLVPTLAEGAHYSEEKRGRAERLLERVGLGGRLSHRPGQLSGGESQRVAVVRALINEPVLLLADEPTGSLDQTNAEKMGDLLLELNREEKVALLVVTHSQHLAQRMGRVLVLREGRLEAAEG